MATGETPETFRTCTRQMLECNGGHSYSLQEPIWSVDRALTALASARVSNQRPSFYTSKPTVRQYR